MKRKIKHPCFKVFTEIMYHNSRLSVLGKEAIQVLEVMKKEGMTKELLEPFVEVAIKAAGAESNEEEKEKEKHTTKRCKWWNRGYCREKGGCLYSHPKYDCEDHLKGSCTTKGCINLRHRKKCKYFNTEAGCSRTETCEYLHQKDVKEKEHTEVKYMDTQTENVPGEKEKETQTPKVKKCFCSQDFKTNEVNIFDDKVICL